MDNQEQSEQQKEALAEALERGEAFEGMTRSKGWEFAKAYYQRKIQTFASSLLLNEGKPITEFENERRELIGLRKFLGFIENDIKILEDERTKAKAKGSAAK